MTSKNKQLTKVISEKAEELQSDVSCGGDLSQRYILTNRDKIVIAVNEFDNDRKFVFEWPNHLTSAISVFVSAVSLHESLKVNSANESEPIRILYFDGATIEVILWLLVGVFIFMFLRSCFFRIRRWRLITADALIGKLVRDNQENTC